jgi:hypothetical protein
MGWMLNWRPAKQSDYLVFNTGLGTRGVRPDCLSPRKLAELESQNIQALATLREQAKKAETELAAQGSSSCATSRINIT